ncbi:MAG TPA: glycosyltransferase [Puia sp.]|nr:glycosyltransferase [Puia sp.]
MPFSPENTPGMRVEVTVISDLVTDYRVHKICQTLTEAGYRVRLTGSKSRQSLDLEPREYETCRIKPWFRRTALFYLEYNIRLFFRLLFRKTDVYLANDLDVIPATRALALMRRKPLVYDSHEYFLGVAGMDGKPLRRKIWGLVERRLFKRLKYGYTVCESISRLYREEYGKTLLVVRNLPWLNGRQEAYSEEEKLQIAQIDNLIPKGKHLLLLQGAGINAFRGAEELVRSMNFLDGKDFHLLLIGGGDVLGNIRKMIGTHQLQDKITIIPKLPFRWLPHFTKQAQLGLSIDHPDVPNHRYSLPNKLFEYLHAGVPVLASHMVEQERIIDQYQVGSFIDSHEPERIAQKIVEIFQDSQQWKIWQENTRLVKKELNWENECKIIIDLFKQVQQDSVS